MSTQAREAIEVIEAEKRMGAMERYQDYLISAKSSFQTLVQHHWGELMRITRASAARGNNLDEKEYATPYTQHKQTITNYQGGGILPVLATLAAVGLGGAGVLGVMKFLEPSAVTVPADTKNPPADKAKSKDVDLGIGVEYQPPR